MCSLFLKGMLVRVSRDPLVCGAACAVDELMDTAFDGWPGMRAVAAALTPHRHRTLSTRTYAALQRRAARVSPHVVHVTPRGGAREMPAFDKLDVRVDAAWAERMRVASPRAFGVVDALVAEARALLPHAVRTFWHVVVTYPGSEAQCVHADHADAAGTYATLVVNVTRAVGEGRTCVLVDRAGRTLREEEDDADTETPAYDALLFAGDVLHFGEANAATTPRVAISVTLTAEREDANDDERVIPPP